MALINPTNYTYSCWSGLYVVQRGVPPCTRILLLTPRGRVGSKCSQGRLQRPDETSLQAKGTHDCCAAVESPHWRVALIVNYVN